MRKRFFKCVCPGFQVVVGAGQILLCLNGDVDEAITLSFVESKFWGLRKVNESLLVIVVSLPVVVRVGTWSHVLFPGLRPRSLVSIEIGV